ncbi:MAG: hypothetical protein AAGF78_13255 [Pseudomonadota bacterium]
MISTRITAGAALLALAPLAVAAQQDAQAPLSAIDWLGTVPVEEALSDPQLALEEPVTASAASPAVEAAPLDEASGPGVGLLPEAASGLPSTLWQGSSAEEVGAAFRALPAEPLRPVALLRERLLLASAAPPLGSDAESFLSARTALLMELGAAEPALALIEAVDPLTPALFTHYADLSLLLNREDSACRRLAVTPSLSDDLALRTFCLARNADWNAAAVTLQTAELLGEISPDLATLLAQFLEPELADAGPPPVDDGDVTPLIVRLREAVGAPLATARLPLLYAQGDLRPEMGWKAQIDAAERLARTGAVSPGQLFALYTSGTPSASGSVWERAAAVQKLDAALTEGRERPLERALEAATSEMARAGLLPQLAEMVALQIDPMQELGAEASRHRTALLLLSDRYEEAAPLAPPVPRGLASGDVTGTAPATALERALVAGFSAQPKRIDGPLGTTILKALAQIEAVRQGDLSRLSDALSTLRSVGLESAARRIALHLWVLS